MGKLIAVSSSLKAFKLEEAVLNSLRSIEPQLADLNTGQLFSGVDSKGNLLKKYKNDLYAEFKKTLNPKGVTDLKLTGDFYDGWFVDASKFPLMFGSDDEKSNELEQRYGKDIFGLNTKSKEAVKKEILPEIGIAFIKAMDV